MSISRLSISLADQSKKTSDTGFYVAETDIENYILGTAGAAIISIHDAIMGVTAMTERQRVVSNINVNGGFVYPVDTTVRRSNKLIVTFKDNSFGGIFTESIPGPDPTKLSIIPGTNNVYIDNTNGTTAIKALVSALNSNAYSRYNNHITVLNMRVAGRAVS